MMLFEIIILLLAIPSGYLIAYLARDELIIGRKYFRILIITGIIGLIGFWIYGRRAESLSCGFIFIVSLVSLLKSDDKKWTKKKI